MNSTLNWKLSHTALLRWCPPTAGGIQSRYGSTKFPVISECNSVQCQNDSHSGSLDPLLSWITCLVRSQANAAPRGHRLCRPHSHWATGPLAGGRLATGPGRREQMPT